MTLFPHFRYLCEYDIYTMTSYIYIYNENSANDVVIFYFFIYTRISLSTNIYITFDYSISKMAVTPVRGINSVVSRALFRACACRSNGLQQYSFAPQWYLNWKFYLFSCRRTASRISRDLSFGRRCNLLKTVIAVSIVFPVFKPYCPITDPRSINVGLSIAAASLYFNLYEMY